jgi:hypothetical protein
LFAHSSHLLLLLLYSIRLCQGYGLTGPALSNANRCVFLNMFTATEAFFGVLFAGFAGAVLFGKITRMNAVAKVLWSDPMVVRYGAGVAVEHKSKRNLKTDEGKEEEEEEVEDDDKMPCPVLEFRLINTAFHRDGGEIANAQISAWASTLAEYAPASIRAAAQLPRRHGRNKKRSKPNTVSAVMWPNRRQQKQSKQNPVSAVIGWIGTAARTVKDKNPVTSKKLVAEKVEKEHIAPAPPSPSHKKMGNIVSSLTNYSIKRKSPKSAVEISKEVVEGEETKDDNLQISIEQAMEEGRASVLKEFHEYSMSQKHITMTEDPDNELLPQLIYSKLDIETDSHPYFKRVWIIRHVLDEKSPLLDAATHDRIVANDGYWPCELNDYQSVRQHLKFNELMVTFAGTDHTTGNTVYSQKVYDYVDVNIGWRFANALIADRKTGKVGVDLSLINDVLEQHGGGAEPFANGEDGGDATILEDACTSSHISSVVHHQHNNDIVTTMEDSEQDSQASGVFAGEDPTKEA